MDPASKNSSGAQEEAVAPPLSARLAIFEQKIAETKTQGWRHASKSPKQVKIMKRG